MACILALKAAFSGTSFSWRQIILIICKYGLNQLCKMVKTEILSQTVFSSLCKVTFLWRALDDQGKHYIYIIFTGNNHKCGVMGE